MDLFSTPAVDIPAEIKKAIAFLHDGTYTDSDMESHMQSLCRTAREDGKRHKEQLERLLFKIIQLKNIGSKIKSGHMNKKYEFSKLRKELNEKATALLNKEYSIDRFIGQTAEQQKLI